MPFSALQDQTVVWPDEVEDNAYVDCLGCDSKLTVVSGHPRDGHWVTRHFRHPQNTECTGGETATHQLMKYVAARTLLRTFDEGKVSRETPVPETTRTGDVLVEFEQPRPVIGNGIVAEAQYQNKTKPKLAVSLEYLNAGYSVVWLFTRGLFRRLAVCRDSGGGHRLAGGSATSTQLAGALNRCRTHRNARPRDLRNRRHDSIETRRRAPRWVETSLVVGGKRDRSRC